MWPFHVRWRWACAAGSAGGRAIGANLGAGWTDGTGVTENALLVDGRLHKLHDAVAIARDPDARGGWTLCGARADLRFTSRRDLRPGLDLGVFAVALDHHVGALDGTLVTDDGERLAVGLRGWCEEFRLGRPRETRPA